MGTDLLKEMKGQVLWLTINRPERRNALNAEVIRGLTDAITEAATSKASRASMLAPGCPCGPR